MGTFAVNGSSQGVHFANPPVVKSGAHLVSLQFDGRELLWENRDATCGSITVTGEPVLLDPEVCSAVVGAKINSPPAPAAPVPQVPNWFGVAAVLGVVFIGVIGFAAVFGDWRSR